ncbi:MAG: hypothetical protein ACR2P8_06350, partial [Myxococcota bacterium]
MAKRHGGGRQASGSRAARVRTSLALVVLAVGWTSAGSSEPAGPPGTIAFLARNGLVEANGSFR